MRLGLSIRQRTMLSFALMALLVLVASGMGLFYTTSAERTVNAVRNGYGVLEGTAEVQVSWLTIVATIDNMLLTRQTSLIERQLDGEMEALNRQLAALQTQTWGETPAVIAQNQKIVADLEALNVDLNGVIDELRDVVREGRWARAQFLRHNDLALLQRRFNDGLEQLSINVREDVNTSVDVSVHTQNLVRIYWIIMTLVALGISSLGGILIVTSVVRPIAELVKTAQAIRDGDLTVRAEVTSRDEIGVLGNAFNAMTSRVRDVLTTLEERVASRTADLERRSQYLQASAEVGQAVTSILDVNQLVQRVVEVIHERFGLYYVGLFQVDVAREWAILRAGTGAAGQAMLARGHRLRIGGGSMIGWAIMHGQARVAQVAEEDIVRQATSELPDTRSEVALPLRSRGYVFGALSLQSDRANAFDEAALTVLQVMANQVSVALDNARLFAESEAALGEVRQAYGELSREAWREFFKVRSDLAFASDASGIMHFETWEPQMKTAAQTGQAAGDGDTLALPIQVRDQVIGVIDGRKSTGTTWSRDEISLLQTLTEQLSTALEGARLYEDTQRRAAREHLAREITAEMRRSLDVTTVLQTALHQLRASLDLTEAEVWIEEASEDASPVSPLAGGIKGGKQ